MVCMPPAWREVRYCTTAAEEYRCSNVVPACHLAKVCLWLRGIPIPPKRVWASFSAGFVLKRSFHKPIPGLNVPCPSSSNWDATARTICSNSRQLKASCVCKSPRQIATQPLAITQMFVISAIICTNSSNSRVPLRSSRGARHLSNFVATRRQSWSYRRATTSSLGKGTHFYNQRLATCCAAKLLLNPWGKDGD